MIDISRYKGIPIGQTSTSLLNSGSIDISRYGGIPLGESIQQIQQPLTREQRIEQGLPVGRGTRVEPTVAGEIVRDVTRLPANVVRNLYGLAQQAGGAPETDIYKPLYSGKYLGNVEGVGLKGQYELSQKRVRGERITGAEQMRAYGRGVAGGIGAGLEGASYLPVGRAVKTGTEALKLGFRGLIRKGLRQGLRTAREGAVGGGLFMGGQAIQEEKPAGEVALETGLGIVAGGVGGLALGGISPIIGKFLKGASKAILEPEKYIESKILSRYEKGVKPLLPGKTTPSQLEKYRGKVINAGLTINENKANLKFTDEVGDEIIGQNPKSLQQLADSIEQTKKRVFSEYDVLAKQAGEAGVSVDMAPIASELDLVINNKALSITSPKTIQYTIEAQKRLLDAGKLDTITAQEVVQNYNKSLEAFYRNPSYDNASQAAVDAMLANRIRQSLDDGISGLTGAQYQVLKNKYGALKAIEKDVIRASLRDARKNVKGLIDFTDIFSGGQVVNGILTMNPGAIAQGLTQKGIASLYKFMTDPNRAIAKMFETIEKNAQRLSQSKNSGNNLLQTQAKNIIPSNPKINPISSTISPPKSKVKPPSLFIKPPPPSTKPLIPKGKGEIPKLPSQGAYGGFAGIETDEEGKVKFSPEKAALGILGVGALRSKAGRQFGAKAFQGLKGLSLSKAKALTGQDAENLVRAGKIDELKAYLKTLGQSSSKIESTISSIKAKIERFPESSISSSISKAKTFQPPKELSTKLLNKFAGMPEEITPQQFNEVINRTRKEGLKLSEENMIKEMAERSRVFPKITKSSFVDTTKGQFNKVKEWNDYTIANVAWHTDREWKIVPKGTSFDVVSERSYKPIAEFHLRDDLWKYIEKQTENKGKISLSKLAKDVETQLVPLTPTPVKSPRWSNVGEDFIGDGKYGEIVYQSPIKTSAGDEHFPARSLYLADNLKHGGENFPNYFSHKRFVDFIDNLGKKVRKYIEWQSDLMQKGKLESEFLPSKQPSDIFEILPKKQAEEAKRLSNIDWQERTPQQKARIEELNQKAFGLYSPGRSKELKKLHPYSSNDPLAHLRMFRQSIKEDAEAGFDYILTPSGETAMKIEGLGQTKSFTRTNEYGQVLRQDNILTSQNMKVGDYVLDNADEKWVITGVLGEGKFKAVPKDKTRGLTFERWKKEFPNEYNSSIETFDISGKVDTQHFVYKLNEEAIPREARKMGLEVIGKIKEGVGEYWKIKIGKERARMPVEALGVAPLLLPGFMSRKEK